ncbi:hypothetical protein BV20DRAFT_943868 [Pilatotrama ljubarskyi]|nr:hypothetical protein BV20DRAFT_943868 [Pilatotrama ljubarskyi]
MKWKQKTDGYSENVATTSSSAPSKRDAYKSIPATNRFGRRSATQSATSVSTDTSLPSTSSPLFSARLIASTSSLTSISTTGSSEETQRTVTLRAESKETYAERVAKSRAQLRELITERLRDVTGESTAQMRWSRTAYLKDVVSRYRVRVEGWPLEEAPFHNLSDIPHLRQVEVLLRNWRDGPISFRAIDEAQLSEMMRDPVRWVGKTSTEDPPLAIEE